MHTIKSSKSIFVLFVLVFFSNYFTFAQPKLVSQKITLKNGKSFSLKLPENFEIIPAAEGLKRVRFFAKSPDGRIFVTDMFDLTDNEKGRIYILDEFGRTDGKIRQSRNYICRNSKTRTASNFTPMQVDKIGFILPKPTNSRGENLKKAKPRQPIKNRRR